MSARPEHRLASDLVEAFAHANDRADALSEQDAREVATILMHGEDGCPPVSRANLASAYRPGVAENLVFALPEDVSPRSLSEMLGCSLLHARALMGGCGVLTDHEQRLVMEVYGIRLDELGIRK